jgi:hypothetical protein
MTPQVTFATGQLVINTFTRAAQEEEGNKIGEDLMIGLWRIILVRNLPFPDQRLNGKIPEV